MWCGSKSSIAPLGDSPGKDLLKAMALSQNAYRDVDEFRKRAEYFQPDVIELIQDKEVDTQVYVLLSKSTRTLYVAFRGTSSAKDAKADATVSLVPVGYSDPNHPTHVLKVVKGFHAQFAAVKDKLFKFASDNAADFDEILITGHSLGAALATIFAPAYCNHCASSSVPLASSVKCITFGCPRVGNRPFGRYYNHCISAPNHWRVHNHRDPIAKVPPALWAHHIPGNTFRIRGSDNDRYSHTHSDTKAIPVLCWDTAKYHATELYLDSIVKIFPELQADHAEIIKHNSSDK